MTTPETVWQQLEAESSAEVLSYRRLDSVAPAQLLAGVRRLTASSLPERVLLLRLPVALARKVGSDARQQGLRLDAVLDRKIPGSAFVALVLTDPALRDIFSVLVADVLDAVGPVPEPPGQLRAFLERLRRWEELFSQYVPGGLGPAARQGLYGELWALRWLLDAGQVTPGAALAAWVGPDRAPQDFRFATAALEIKTTSGSSQTLHIGGLWQLDEDQAGPLFLLHLPLAVGGPGAEGETLPTLVAALAARFAADPAQNARFGQRLLAAGYLHTQAGLYKAEVWRPRPPRLFAVVGDFPRLRAGHVPAAITAAAYDLEAPALDPWLCLPTELFTLLA